MTGTRKTDECAMDVPAHLNPPGLSSQIPFWKEALEMVLDVEPGSSILNFESADTHSSIIRRGEFSDHSGRLHHRVFRGIALWPCSPAVHRNEGRLASHGEQTRNATVDAENRS